MTSVGIVLGAGGATGAAWHAGALAAVEDLTGVDLRRADLTVGTSAGAIVAGMLRSGLSAADYWADLVGEPPSRSGRQILARRGEPLTVLTDRDGWNPKPLPGSPRLIAESVRGVWPPRVGVALTGVLPRGTISLAPLIERSNRVAGVEWFDQPCWVCAIRYDDGQRVVFGRDDVADHPDVGTAIGASSAVPAYFAPVRIGDKDYVDGAAHSYSNADLTAGLGLDVVIVSSPKSSRSPRWRSPGRAARHADLMREVQSVAASGTEVLVLEPDREDEAVLGERSMDTRRVAAVARHSRAVVSARLRADPGPYALAALERLRRT